jgi:hypothetical protein
METNHISSRPKTLTEALKAECEFRHFKRNTFLAYNAWLKRFWVFSGRRAPRELGTPEERAFLESLRHGSASAQNQAFNALIFIYHKVLKIELGELKEIPRAKKFNGIPVATARRPSRAQASNISSNAESWATKFYEQ